MEVLDENSYSILSDLQSEFRSMKQEINDLKSRVNLLEGAISRTSSCSDDIQCGNKRQRECKSYENSISRKYRDICDFCTPLRCRTCEERISMIPSIVSLLVKNDFIGVQELGVLSCASPVLHQFICVESDDDIWSTLLRRKWPSTTMIPNEVRSGLPSRVWMQRLVMSEYPSTFEYRDKDQMQKCFAMRQQYRQQLHAVSGNSGSLSPLPDPSLRACDLLILVDMFCDGKAIAFTAEYGADRLSSFLSVGCLNLHSLICPNPLEVMAENYGWFDEVDKDLISGKVHLVRLTDFKIICIYKTGRTTINHFEYDQFDCNDKLSVNEFNLKTRLGMYTDGCFGNIPTSLTSRIGDDSDRCIGMFSQLSDFDIHLPRSPYHFGYEYTVSQYREYINNNGGGDNDLPLSDFYDFRESMWSDAASNPNLVKFFKQAKEVESINGKFYGTICEPEDCYMKFKVSILSHKASFKVSDISDWGMTFLHILEDFFDHNVTLSREDDGDAHV